MYSIHLRVLSYTLGVLNYQSLKLWMECNTFLSVGSIKLDRPTLKRKAPHTLHCGSPSPVRCLSLLTPSGVSSNCYHNLLTEQAQSLLLQWKFKLVYILSLRDLYFKPNVTWKVLSSYSWKNIWLSDISKKY